MQTIWGYAETRDGYQFALITEDGTRVAVERPDGAILERDADETADGAEDNPGGIEDGKLVVVEGEVVERAFDDRTGAYRDVAVERPLRVRAQRIAVGRLAYKRIAESFQLRAIPEEDYVDPFEDIDSVAVPLFEAGDDPKAGPLRATDVTAKAMREYPGIGLPVLCLAFFVFMLWLTWRGWDVRWSGTELIQSLAYGFAMLAGFIAYRPQVRPPPLFVRNEPMERVTKDEYLALGLILLTPLAPLFFDPDGGPIGTAVVGAFTMAITLSCLRHQRVRRVRSVRHLRTLLGAAAPANASPALDRGCSTPEADARPESLVGIWRGVVVDPTPALVGDAPVALARTHDTAVSEKTEIEFEGGEEREKKTQVRHEWSRFQTRDTFLVDTGRGVIEVDPNEIAWTSTYAIRTRVFSPGELIQSSRTEPFRHCAIPVGGQVLVAGRVEPSSRLTEWRLCGLDGDHPAVVIGAGATGVPERYIRKALYSRQVTVAALWLVAVAHVATVSGLWLRYVVGGG